MPIVVTPFLASSRTLSPCLNWLGQVANPGALPPSANDGDAYSSLSDGNIYAWFDGQWNNLGPLTGGPPGPSGYGFNFKGCAPDQASLPASGNAIGDVWSDDATKHMWWWDGTQWCDMGCMAGEQGDPGIPGIPGDDGDQGLPAWTFSSADFTVPPLGGTVVVDVENSAWMTIGEYVWIQGSGGTVAGQMRIVDKLNGQVVLANVEPPVAGAIAAGDLLSTDLGNLSRLGSDNLIYTPSIPITMSAFTIPQAGQTATVTLNDTSWIIPGQYIWVQVTGQGAQSQVCNGPGFWGLPSNATNISASNASGPLTLGVQYFIQGPPIEPQVGIDIQPSVQMPVTAYYDLDVTPTSGYYFLVVSKGAGNVVTLMNPSADSAPPGTSVPAGSLVTPSGAPGILIAPDLTTAQALSSSNPNALVFYPES